MKFYLAAFWVATLAACAGTSAPVTMDAVDLPEFRNATGVDTPPVVTPGDRGMAELLNDLRIDTGAGTLRYDARLDRAAQGHADDMVQNDYFGHISRDGLRVTDRVQAEGYDPTFVAENIARGVGTEQEAFDAWQRSDGHRANHLDPRAEDFGLGVAGRGFDTTWVLILGAE